MNDSDKTREQHLEALSDLRRHMAETEAAEAEHRKTFRKLEELKEEYRQVFEAFHVPVLIIEPESAAIVDCNRAAGTFYGHAPDKLRQMGLLDLTVLSQEELFRELMRSASGGAPVFRFRQRLASGEVRDVNLFHTVISAGGRKLMSFIVEDVTAIVHKSDITRRLDELRAAVAFSASLLLSSPDSRTGLKAALQALGTSAGAARLDAFELVQEPAEGTLLARHHGRWLRRTNDFDTGDPLLQNIPCAALLPPGCNDLRAGRCVIARTADLTSQTKALLEGEGVGTILVAPAVVEDRVRGLLMIGDPTPGKEWSDKEEALFCLASSCLTGAILRETEDEKLRESLRRYTSMVDAAADVLFQTDATGLWSFLSSSWKDITGFAPEKSLGDFWLNYVHPEDRQSAAQEFQALLEGQTGSVSGEIRFLGKDGADRLAHLRVSSLRDGAGRVTGTAGIIQDRPSMPLTLEQIRHNRLFEQIKDMVFVTTPEGRMLDINRAGTETLGYTSRDEVLSLNAYRDIFADQEAGKRFGASLEDKGFVKDFELPMRSRDGNVLTLMVSAVRSAEPSQVVYQAVARDVTSRRKTEQENLFARKMEAIGQLAGGVAHDFNNILTGIRGYAEILRTRLAPDNSLTAYVDRIIRSSERGANLTEGLMAFSRKRKTKTEPVNVEEVISGVRDLLSKVLGADIRLVMRLSGENPTVLADSGQLEQVLLHLAANARDAMPSGGMLTVTTEVVQLDAEFRKRHGYGEPGAFIRISFADTGIGMDTGTRERVFEPFFTTKEVGKGTGLGLSIAYGIIKQHQGYITVSSSQGKGTVFDMYLPLLKSREERPQPAEFSMPQGGSETILVAEDDEVVGDLIRSILEGFGYHVVSAVDGEDALAKFREHKDRLHLVISDVIMPRKTGKEVYEEIRTVRPDLKVIFISGYDDDIACGRGISEKGLPIIQKPFSTSDLLNRVRSLLDEQPVA